MILPGVKKSGKQVALHVDAHRLVIRNARTHKTIYLERGMSRDVEGSDEISIFLLSGLIAVYHVTIPVAVEKGVGTGEQIRLIMIFNIDPHFPSPEGSTREPLHTGCFR